MPAAKPWPVRPIAGFPFSTEPVLPSGSRVAYAVTVSYEGTSTPQRLVSVDLTSGKVATGARIPADSFLVSYGARVYAISPSRFDSSGHPQEPWDLRKVVLPGMALAAGVPLGKLGSDGYAGPSLVAFQPEGADAGYLWVAGIGRVELINPRTGAVVKSVRLPGGDGYGVAAEPDGRYVDVSLLTVGDGAGEVVAIDSATGKIAKTVDKIYAVGPPGLTAAPGGLWVSYRSGMLGTSIHVTESALKSDTPISGEGTRPLPGLLVGMGEQASLAGRVVLLTDIFGATCLAAGGTKPLAKAPFPGGTWATQGRSWTPFAAAGATVYVTTSIPGSYASQEVAAATLPSAC
jgi:hypothetical protein